MKTLGNHARVGLYSDLDGVLARLISAKLSLSRDRGISVFAHALVSFRSCCGIARTPTPEGESVSGFSDQSGEQLGERGNRPNAQSVWVLSGGYAWLATFASAVLADLPISLAILSVSVILTSVA